MFPSDLSATPIVIQPSPIPTVPQQLKEVREIISDWIYDSVSPQTTTSSSVFFTVSVGGLKTLADTNLSPSGQLPFTERFHILGIGADIRPKVRNVSNPADLAALDAMLDGSWEFVLNNKTYERGPICGITSFKVEATGQIAASTLPLFVFNPFFHAKGYWPFAQGYVLNPGAPFSVEVIWRNAPGAALAVNPWQLYLYLFGARERTVQ